MSRFLPYRFCGSTEPHAEHDWNQEVDTSMVDHEPSSIRQNWRCQGLAKLDESLLPPAEPVQTVPPTVDKVTFHCNGGVQIELDFVTGQWITSHKKVYAITATVETQHGSPGDHWTGMRQVPTFYLDPAVQGIVDAAHARTIAASILQSVLSTEAQAGKWPKLHITVAVVEL